MYTKKYIDVITLALVSLIFILLNLYQFQIQGNIQKILNNAQFEQEEATNVIEESIQNNVDSDILDSNIVDDNINSVNALNQNKIVEPIDKSNNNVNINNSIMPITEKKYPKEWNIIIPIIDLIAPISEGTSKEVLNKTVGHFEESELLNGNVCLAAHNRGYNVNYFEGLKDLVKNDLIVYQYGDIDRVYAISNIAVIKETDWSYIDQKSSENMLTLITCIDDKPEYRLCVQAKELK